MTKVVPTGPGAQLLELLQTLRRQLVIGPKRIFPAPDGFKGNCPGAGYFSKDHGGIAEILEAIRKLKGDDGKPYLHSANIARDTREVLNGLRRSAYELDRLPAPPSIVARLDALIVDLGGTKPEGSGPWSEPDTPTRWAHKFNVAPVTFKRWVKAGKVRAKILTDRSYQVHIDDLPQSKMKPVR